MCRQLTANASGMQQSFFIGLLIAVTVAFVALLSGFFQPIFWAATIGILFLPVQHYLESKFAGRKSLAAVTAVILIFFTVLVPALVVASAVIQEAAQLFGQIQSGEIDPGAILRWLQRLTPRVTEWAHGVGIDVDTLPEKLSAAALTGSQFIASMALTAGQNVANFMVKFFLMLYLLFFVLRDGDMILEQIIHALPLGDERERALFAKFAEMARAVLKGTLVVGLVQGFLGGMMFWALGIEGAVFWGVLMGLLSFLPIVGASLVWGPAAVFLLASGAYIKAAILVFVGAVIIGLADNVLRPLLVGRDTRMPDYLILLSTLGGLTLFGISGFVIGPIIASLFLAVWVMFRDEYAA
jgi:predicted PurR-regulated permease PerM